MAFRISTILFSLSLIILVHGGKLPNEDDLVLQNRLHMGHKLSDQDHYIDTNNDSKLEHNQEYDHEAFMGKDESDKFKSLTPEESKERLGQISDKIDHDKDGFVTLDELHQWIKGVKNKTVAKDVDQRWEEFDSHNSLDQMLETNYGQLKHFLSSSLSETNTVPFLPFSKIVEKIDKNHDGLINENELRNWIRHQHKNILEKYTSKKWNDANTDKDDLLSFNELLQSTIGGLETWTDQEKQEKKDQYQLYQRMMERSKKRFLAADFDKDGKLSKKEYGDYLHPEESNTMRDIIIDETFEDLDKNGDGQGDLEEFIAYIYPDAKSNEIEPDWVREERNHFKTLRDKDGDGVLNRDEIANWILPIGHDHTLSEAKHLIHEADENQDGKLTKDEILNKYSVFVASQATAYGDAIYNKEDL